eukprot:TRINITY_DN778_c0_g2_i2.p2 TRINITY_DN778_c0_g2~~TRINITY_DN778_c0_g2_i2.p2  ORF type:complete len:216 (-),score=-25.36 TRINITY_DN778_c0_g2_i2:246-893(-)
MFTRFFFIGIIAIIVLFVYVYNYTCIDDIYTNNKYHFINACVQFNLYQHIHRTKRFNPYFFDFFSMYKYSICKYIIVYALILIVYSLLMYICCSYKYLVEIQTKIRNLMEQDLQKQNSNQKIQFLKQKQCFAIQLFIQCNNYNIFLRNNPRIFWQCMHIFFCTQLWLVQLNLRVGCCGLKYCDNEYFQQYLQKFTRGRFSTIFFYDFNEYFSYIG